MTQKHENTTVRRSQIIDAARKLIIEYGSEHVTVKRIAKKVGISEAAIYRHFKSKKDILSLLAEHIEDDLVGDITKSKVGDHNSLEVVNHILRSHISSIERRRGVSFQIIAEIVSLGDARLNKKISVTIDKYIEHIESLLSEGVKAGEIRDDVDLKAAATLLFGMMQGLVNIWALSNYGFNPEDKYESLWNVFREAIVKH